MKEKNSFRKNDFCINADIQTKDIIYACKTLENLL